MSTFSSISLTVGVAALFCGTALAGFSMAVQCEANGLLAPRTYARPKQVLKNILKRPFSLRWISWALNLTYLEMLQGIPGTGTRNKGWSGLKLKANLDGIVLLKYHSLCLKVSIFATLLCLTIILPIYKTATCNPDISGMTMCSNMTRLTDFENTTLAHIPAIHPNQADGLLFLGRSWRIAPGLTLRLWMVVLVAYSIYFYTCVLIWEQWIENLALRRVFYLEFNHYQARKEELEALDNLEDPEDPCQRNRPAFLPQPELRDTVPNVSLYSVLYKLPSVHFATLSSATSSEVQRQLETAVEFFDKVIPNQPGYSSSVAAVTILPDVNQVSKAWKKWFDCANKLRRLRYIRKRLQLLQEGQDKNVEVIFNDDRINDSDIGSFRSSPTGISGEPAFRNSDKSKNSADDDNRPRVKQRIRTTPRRALTPVGGVHKLETVDEGSTGDLSSDVDLVDPEGVPSDVQVLMTNKCRSSDSYGIDDDSLGSAHYNVDDVNPILEPSEINIRTNFSPPRVDRIASDVKKNRFLASVGVAEESKLEMFMADEDIEQMTVYCREYARSSASCCPYGCDAYVIRNADAATLADLEQEAEEAVQQANEELRLARAEVHRRLPGPEDQMQPFGSSDKNDSKRSDVERNEDRSYKCTNGENDFLGIRNALVHQSSVARPSSLSNRWEEAEKLVASERNVIHKANRSKKYFLDNGHWPNPFHVWNRSLERSMEQTSKKPFSEGSSSIIDTDSYAVVTFTSRQAAIAARQCLADGCGLDRWREIDCIPIPPLADAPPWNILDCRGCCRPVSVTLPIEQKRWRGNFVVVVVVLFCLSYTIPLTYFSALVTPNRLETAFPDIPQIGKLSGLLSGGMRVIFFALCPQIFKSLSNFGSGAASIQQAERRAIRYYWFFMLVTAFTGTSLATVFYEGVVDSLDVGGTVKGVLKSVANTVPTTVSAQWLSWIIFRTGITLPYNYLLQFNNFLFSSLGWHCCARATTGGGPGGVPPFRIYVDCGVVFLCVVGLAPACPLIAPFAMLCYLLLIPMLRWLIIFTYRPHYDGGGFKWPLLHNILISSMIWAQIVLAAMMGVKRAYGAAILAGLAIIPTYTFHVICKDRFMQSYKDAGLLQTSELDGWNVDEETSMKEREGFRKWLVDCHKASYIPVCVNGEDNFLTAEPAVVIVTERDRKDDDSLGSFPMAPMIDSPDCSSHASPISGGGRQRSSTFDSYHSWRSHGSACQRGALFRRVTGHHFLHAVPPRDTFSHVTESRGRTVSGGSAISFSQLDTVFDDEEDHDTQELREKNT
ncbi:protein of unknown function DUF221-domain containing protein [Nitzschia inconspicua]|uniref:CSC1/OSCA1-like 7TM region domain-containing protein n=1 Tax=Nitzschia inconspicua TaxID=303405 RepID=A0A9K3PKG2_9STRA|nr:protein of unknown function DUF221-domain containing protein [Nitzschia inconspicua]